MLKRLLSIAIASSLSCAAVAQGAASSVPEHMQGNFSLASFMPMILLVAIIYFLLLRPQMKKNREHRNLVASLKSGDEVITASGMMGKINRIGENFIELTISENVHIKMQKDSVSAMMPKGTSKID